MEARKQDLAHPLPLSVTGWERIFQNKSLRSLLSLHPMVLPGLSSAPLSVMEGSGHQDNGNDDDHDGNGTPCVVRIFCAKNCHKHFKHYLNSPHSPLR